MRKRGYHLSTNGISTGALTWPADDGILLLSTIADDPKPEQVRDLAGSGPQLACERWGESSPGALDAGGRRRGFRVCSSPTRVMSRLRTRCSCPIVAFIDASGRVRDFFQGPLAQGAMHVVTPTNGLEDDVVVRIRGVPCNAWPVL